MKNAYSFLLFSCLMMFVNQGMAQPYLDLINARITNSPESGIITRNKEKIKLSYYNISTTIPFLFKNKKDAVIVSPFFEKWQFELVDKNEEHHYYGLALPVSFLKQINLKYSLLITGILRMNDSSAGFTMKKQVGGAIIASYKKRENLTFKFGAYVNGEYFGLFIMPLLGIDWQINEKDCVFGVLPGNLTYQHLLSQKFGYGIAFRAQTNSYNRPTGKYTRINENQLGGFVDIYLSKNIVLNAETGHSFFRKIRTDQVNLCVNSNCDQKYYNYDVNDNFYFKLSLAYRISLRK